MESDILKDYVQAKQPELPNGDVLYLRKELQKVARSISLLNEVVKQIDARLVAHGI